MDLLSYIVEKYTNNIITKEYIISEMSAQGIPVNKSEIDDVFTRLLHTHGAYQITNDAISLVYKPTIDISVSNECDAVKKSLKSELSNVSFNAYDTSSFIQLFPKQLNHRFIIIEIDKNSIQAVFDLLSKNNFDVYCERKRRSASAQFITTFPILLKVKTSNVDSSPEFFLAYVLQNPQMFNLNEQNDVKRYINNMIKTFPVNYDKVFSQTDYRKRDKIKRILLDTPEYAFLMKRLKHIEVFKKERSV